ncbi:AAA family ATPase [Desulfobacula sp.]|uniref:AAA family ATPase n=1 Tax=Desulfobacula sp. TaxID=2593537 RepID=UPI00260FB789|nr:AAA family ATPase [Desulfobacula sp.]
MSILIKTVRIAGFRGLKNLEVMLEQTTILTGMNNTGKTSFLKALQLALGNRQFVSQDDFFIQGSSVSEKIIIDLLIVSIDGDGKRCEDFSEDWEILFTTDRIRNDVDGKAFVPLRTIITFDAIKNSYKTQQFILQEWPEFKKGDIDWFGVDNSKKTSFHFDEVPFFYMDAQRDILEDTKLRSSYLGKMLSKIEYSKEDIKEIEEQIELLNEKAVSSSDILSNIKTTLKELDTAMDTRSEGIEITPFTKKIRDLNKGLTIYYTDRHDSFSMEYHGMGTRSWSSLLTLKSFIALLLKNAEKEKSVFFPVLAIEEPEAHLHPNAQKKLFGQINAISGQKIIATHSPYIAATANLGQIRNFYKEKTVTCGRIEIDNLEPEDIRKINRQVINTRGEIFFSKLIVFFEGETEEQALPIFAQKHFNKTPVEMGLDFVGVGGHGNYLPFLRFAAALNIPWIIFSDAENTPDKNIKSSVQQQFLNCGSPKSETDCIVFVDDGNDFEKQLISDGFGDKIKKAIASLDVYTNDEHREAKEQDRLTEIESYDDDKLYDVITGRKAQYGPAIAEQIIQSEKDLPPKVIALFNKISAILKIEEAEA